MSTNSTSRHAVAFACLLVLALAAPSVVPRPSAAADSPQLTSKDEIAIRGTVLSVDPATRTVVIESSERDTLSYRASDRVTNFRSLKPGMLVDVRYYRVMDYLVARTTPEVTARVNDMLSDPAKAPGVAGTQMRAKLWSVSGIVVRTDLPAKKAEVVNPEGGLVYRTPWIKSASGQATLAELKPGDKVTMVFSERLAFEITPVR
jgi:hypothetical protein